MKRPKRILVAVAVAHALGSAAVYAEECVLPQTPSKIPDGSTSTEQEMLRAMDTLKQYNGDVETYLKCLDFEVKQNRMSKADEEHRHNDAVDTLNKVASKFNDQVRTFKARKG